NVFKNPIIHGVLPNINSTINLGTVDPILISYNVPIIQSSKNIYIYQQNNSDFILRQTFSGQSQYCSLFNQTAIKCDVLSSTFNQPNSIYYIKVDDNFVRNNDTSEHLGGIGNMIWKILT
ncbi:6689_t:CDS:1, partial [Scutellospora calospora]